MEEALIVFTKNVVPGEVKSRLAAGIGQTAALSVYKKLLAYTAAQILPMQVAKFIYYNRFLPAEDIFSTQSVGKHLQASGHLGHKMQAAIGQRLIDYQKVVLIGSDCPEIRANHIQNAFEALNTTDVVFGPATDGGYYLIGMKQLCTCVFANIPWSTPEVLSQSVAAAQANGYRYTLLETLSDIDTKEDLANFAHFLP